MAELELKTVGWLLENARSLSRWDLACFPQLSPLAPDDACLVVDSRDLDEDEDVSPEAQREGLTRTLLASQIVDILDNLGLQVPSPSEAQILDALNYYIAADAFISFADDGPME